MVERAGTDNYKSLNKLEVCQLHIQDEPPSELSINRDTGEVWDSRTGGVIGILQQQHGYWFIHYSNQFAPLANRHFNSIEDFRFHYEQIAHESRG